MRKALTFCMVLGVCWISAPIALAEDLTGQVEAVTTQGSGSNRAKAIADIMNKNRKEKSATVEVSKPENNTGSMALRMIQGLGIVVGLFIIGAHYYKKYVIKSEPKQTRSIKIVERTPLGSKNALILAEIEGQRVLVGLSAESISLIKLEAPVVKLEESIMEGSEELWFDLQKASASS